MKSKFNIIAAACENMGIGKNGDLPWKLRKEMAYFTKMTSSTKDKDKKNAVIMGRLTWESIPPKYKPLQGRLNVVISKSLREIGSDAVVFDCFDKALTQLAQPPYLEFVENIWVIGGSLLYKEAIHSNCCHRIYLTKINKFFECDTFFPQIPPTFSEVRDLEVPSETQEENGIYYEYKVYELAGEA